MIKYIKNTLFLLILLYNNLLVNSQYKTLLTPNLLNFGQNGKSSDRLFSNGDHTKFGDGRMNSFGRNPKVGNPPNSFGEDTISNDAAGSFEQDTKVTNNLLNTHQETKNSKINNIGQDAKVTDKPNLDLNRIYRQLLNHLLLRKENGNGRSDTKNDEDGEEFNRKPRQTEEAVPTGRRRLKKLKTVYADRVDTSTDTNRDDAYYVTNIESTNVDKQGIGAESSGEMDGKTETNAKTTTTQGASERKFEVYAESPATHKDDGRKFEVYPANRDKDKFENHASNNDGINTKENYASNSDGIDTKETHGNGDGKETYAKGAIDRKFEYGDNSLESKEILDSVTSEVTRNTIDESVRKIEQDEYTNKYNEMDLNPVNTTDREQETSKANGQSSAETTTGHVKSGTDQGNSQLDSKDKGNDDKTTKGVGEVYQTSSESDNDTSARNNTNGEKSNQSGENFKKLFTTHAGPGRFFERKKDLLKSIVGKRCHNRYSFMCFKIDLMKIIDRLNSTDQFTVLPGELDFSLKEVL